MPRPILAPAGTAGLATYTLSPHDEFTVLAVTFSLVPNGAAGGDNFAWLDYRDPAGGIIYLQPLAPGDGANMFYSLAANASEWSAETGNPFFFPQESNGFGFNYVSQGLPVITLYTGCTVNAYKTVGSESPPTDPITAVSPDYSIPDLHLWVEDVGVGTYTPPEPLPPILVHAPELV